MTDREPIFIIGEAVIESNQFFAQTLSQIEVSTGTSHFIPTDHIVFRSHLFVLDANVSISKNIIYDGHSFGITIHQVHKSSGFHLR